MSRTLQAIDMDLDKTRTNRANTLGTIRRKLDEIDALRRSYADQGTHLDTLLEERQVAADEQALHQLQEQQGATP